VHSRKANSRLERETHKSNRECRKKGDFKSRSKKGKKLKRIQFGQVGQDSLCNTKKGDKGRNLEGSDVQPRNCLGKSVKRKKKKC